MDKVSDDKCPMTGLWYRAADGSGDQCKVLAVGPDTAVILITGGYRQRVKVATFAFNWELV